MTFSRALAIVTVATLPLAALSARAFVSTPAPDSGSSELPRYDGDAAAIEGAKKRAADALAAAPADPVGWGQPKKPASNDLAVEYRVAAVLATSDQAAGARGSGAGGDVTAAITAVERMLEEPSLATIEALPASGPKLVAALRAQRSRLGRHKQWLDDREDMQKRITEMAGKLVGDPLGANEKDCLDSLRKAVTDYPTVVADDSADEPASSRTSAEDRSLRALLARARFRGDWVEAMTPKDPAVRFRLLEQFVGKHAAAPDPADAGLLEQAREAIPAARLAFHETVARSAESAADFAAALKQWLAIPADPRQAGPDTRKQDARKLIHDWLEVRLPAIAVPPELAGLGQLQEGVYVDGDSKRLTFGIFEAIRDDDRSRYWRDNEQKNEKDDAGKRKYPRGFTTLRISPPGPKPPRCLSLRADYDAARNSFLKDPLVQAGPAGASAAGKFADDCDRLTGEATALCQVPVGEGALAHPLGPSYKTWTEALERAFEAAARAAREFDAVGRASRLDDLLKP